MPSDIEIAQSVRTAPISQIAGALRLGDEQWEPYGRGRAKLTPGVRGTHEGKLILVTAMTPTPAGEGKTTVSVALADGMRRAGFDSILALREPSLGPVFGMKGGATGGGYAQVVPMEDINLHFTGDLHAITAANNLFAAMIDNHIQQGNALGIDPRRVTWRRCMDMNDRQLRHIVSGLGGTGNGMPREDGFDITAASEVMAVLCLSADYEDLKARLSRMLAGYTFDGREVTCADINAQGAMAALLRDALRPNLVQSLEGTPCLMHGGPFANIAHGCNSVIATKTALTLADYCVTEAGFGADLGAEKFLDIKCRMAGLKPSAVVVVATVRALRYHGLAQKRDAAGAEAVRLGMANLMRHVNNIRDNYGLPVVVAVNRFSADTEEELGIVKSECEAQGVRAEYCDGWAHGGEGTVELAKSVVKACAEEPAFRLLYPDDMKLEDKIKKIARSIYHAEEVAFAPGVRTSLRQLDKRGHYPVCVAKTQYSFSDDPKKLGAPENFTLNVRSVRLSAGAGFAVVFTGEIIAMPGLPRVPAAEGIDIDGEGVITGLF